jgi:signal transduction histidine kinase
LSIDHGHAASSPVGGAPAVPEVVTSAWHGLAELLVHDARTPLNAVQGFTELILAGAAGPVGRDLLDYIHQIAISARALARAVQDLEELAVLDASIGGTPDARTDLAEILARQGFAVVDPNPFSTTLLVRGDRATWQRVIEICQSHLLGSSPEEHQLHACVGRSTAGGIEIVLEGSGLEPWDGTGQLSLELARRLAERQGCCLSNAPGRTIRLAWLSD